MGDRAGSGGNGREGYSDTTDDADEAESAALIEAAGTALFRLGRIFGRRSTQQRLSDQRGRAIALSHILVVQAVDQGPGEPGMGVSVGDVARRLAIDPSTASRVVAETIEAGYLAREASAVDGRAVHLALTARGHALAAEARRYQRAVFAALTRDWPDEERRIFARLFVKFADALSQTGIEPPA